MRAHYCFTPLRILSARPCSPVFPDQSPRMRRDSLWRARHAVSPVAGADHSRQRMVCVSPLDCRAVTYTGIILELTDNGLYCAVTGTSRMAVASGERITWWLRRSCPSMETSTGVFGFPEIGRASCRERV